MEINNSYLIRWLKEPLSFHPVFFALKNKDMPEDRKENEMQIVASVDYLRGLKGKDSVAITPANLLSGLFQDRGGISNANQAILSGIYNGVSITNAPESDYSDIVVFRTMGYIHQLFFPLNSDRIYYRRSLNSGASWYGWRPVSIT